MTLLIFIITLISTVYISLADLSENSSNETQPEIPSANLSENNAPIIESYTPKEEIIIQVNEPQIFTLTVSDIDNDILQIQWFVNGFAITDQVSESFEFISAEEGTFEIKALVTDNKDYITQKWTFDVSSEGIITIPEENITLPETNETQPEENPTEENITLPETNETQPEENPTLPENVTEPIEETIETGDKLTQLPAEINKPVKWIRTIKNENLNPTITIQIPKEAINLEVKKVIPLITEEIKETIPSEKLILDGTRLSSNSLITGLTIAEPPKRKSLAIRFLKNIFKITGFTILNPELQTKELTIEETAAKYEISYETPAPIIEEKELQNGKSIKIYADYEYKNILTYTNITETNKQIKLYWLTNSTKILHKAELLDTNNNNQTDKIQWITKHLSEQTFEIQIGEQNQESDIIQKDGVYYIKLKDVDYFTKWPVPISEEEESLSGYIENPEYFCTKTNSLETPGADLGAEITFNLIELPKGKISEANICAYAFTETNSNITISNYIQVIQEEKRKKNPKVEKITTDLTSGIISPEKGWKCITITEIVQSALNKKEEKLHLKWIGEDSTEKGIEQMVCFKSNSRDFDTCGYNPTEAQHCDPYLSIIYKK